MSGEATAPEASIRADAGIVTLINVFTVDPSGQQQLIELWQTATEEVMRHQPGFVGPASTEASMAPRSSTTPNGKAARLSRRCSRTRRQARTSQSSPRSAHPPPSCATSSRSTKPPRRCAGRDAQRPAQRGARFARARSICTLGIAAGVATKEQSAGSDGQSQAEAARDGWWRHCVDRLVVEVVAVIQVLDQPGVGRLPGQQLAGQLAGRGVVQRDEGAEEGEVLIRVLGRDAGARQAELAADVLRDVPEGHAIVSDRVQPRSGRSGLQRQPVYARRVERVHRGQLVGPVAEIAGDALLASDADQGRAEAVVIQRAVHQRREAHDRGAHAALTQRDRGVLSVDPRSRLQQLVARLLSRYSAGRSRSR